MHPESNATWERRSKSRFPLRLEVRYRILSGGPSLIGVGRTVNMSSRGLLIASEDAMRKNRRIELKLTER